MMGVSNEAADAHEEWQYLTTQEKWTRSLGIPIPDAEAIHAQFNFSNKEGHEGITSKNFPKMLQALSGEVFSDAKIHDLWRTIDQDGNGHISFDEYLDWHYKNCRAPKLSFHSDNDATQTC